MFVTVLPLTIFCAVYACQALFGFPASVWTFKSGSELFYTIVVTSSVLLVVSLDLDH